MILHLFTTSLLLQKMTLLSFLAAIEESAQSLSKVPPALTDMLTSSLVTQCTVQLKQANDIPRLYRRTNKEVDGI